MRLLRASPRRRVQAEDGWSRADTRQLQHRSRVPRRIGWHKPCSGKTTSVRFSLPGYEREKCWLSSFLPYFLLPSFHKKEMSKSLQMSPTSAGHRVLWKLAQKPLIPLGTAPLEVFVHISAKISASVHIYVVIRALFPNNNVGIS